MFDKNRKRAHTVSRMGMPVCEVGSSNNRSDKRCKDNAYSISHLPVSGMCVETEKSVGCPVSLSSNHAHAAFLFGSIKADIKKVINREIRMKKKIAKILLFIASNIFTRLPITNFTSRLIDKLIVASGK